MIQYGVNIPITELKKTLYTIAIKYVSSDEATYFVDETLEAHIRKYPRQNILKETVVADTKRQEKYKNNKIEITKDLPALIKIDFHHLPMTFKMKWLHDIIIEKARLNGIAILAFDNSGGMHTLHTWTQGLAKRGYFALASYNGGPAAVVPANGTRGLLGTNPISYAFPTQEGTTVIDMATSEAPFFDISNAKRTKQPLKSNVAVDNNGEMTTDPTKALDEAYVSNILPIGGSYKGYLINYLFEIMTGSLIGSSLSDVQDLAYINEEHGGFIIVVDTNAFSSVSTFKKDVSRFNKVIKSQKPKEGTKIVIPGETNLAKLLNTQQKNSITIDEETWNELTSLI